jgi:nitrate/TMAO reductase-like tetraheme cytochrome c subunit
MRAEGLPVADKPANEGLFRNRVCVAGGILVAVGAAATAGSIPIRHGATQPGPVFPIFSDVLFPSLMVLGALLFFVGMRREARRWAWAAAAAFAVMALLAVAGRNAYLFAESRAFCGKTCHASMEPEDTANLRSPHARVPCVDCHVGNGIAGYVRSKVQGMRELYDMVLDTYDRPIVAARDRLPRVRETCRACHWAEEHFGARLLQRPHFRYDATSTAEQISLLVKTGGGGPKGEGIHFRMFIEKEITFVAEDRQRQRIPWVKATSKSGASVEYFSTDRKIGPDKIASMPRYVVDCVDCHNRSGHPFESLELAIDEALAAGTISPTLPWVKKVAVDAAGREYPSRGAANDGIRREIGDYYAKNHPDVSASRAPDIARAGETVSAIRESNEFPGMKVDWTTYPSNGGHTSAPGCFRCHDGKHVSPDGRVLSNDCALCHTLPQRAGQAPLGEMIAASANEWHPWQIGTKHLAAKKHSEILCHECHSAGRRPKTECEDCHR